MTENKAACVVKVDWTQQQERTLDMYARTDNQYALKKHLDWLESLNSPELTIDVYSYKTPNGLSFFKVHRKEQSI